MVGGSTMNELHTFCRSAVKYHLFMVCGCVGNVDAMQLPFFTILYVHEYLMSELAFSTNLRLLFFVGRLIRSFC